MAKQNYSHRTTNEELICAHTKFRGMYTNVSSLANKMEELELLIHEEDLNFVGISETWSDSSHD